MNTERTEKFVNAIACDLEEGGFRQVSGTTLRRTLSTAVSAALPLLADTGIPASQPAELAEQQGEVIGRALADAYTAGAVGLQFGGLARLEALTTALAATGKQQVGEVVLYQVRQEIVREDSLGSSNVIVKERLNAWRDISKIHYDAYLSVMGGCGPTGVLGHPDGPVALELNQYAPKTEVRALYAAPPAQGIDLGTFPVVEWQQHTVGGWHAISKSRYDDYARRKKMGERVPEIRALIDQRDAAPGVG